MNILQSPSGQNGSSSVLLGILNSDAPYTAASEAGSNGSSVLRLLLEHPAEEGSEAADPVPAAQVVVELFSGDSDRTEGLREDSEEVLNYWVNYDPESEHLTVKSPARVMGRFFTGQWGDTAGDRDLRHLLHGYRLTEWEDGRFRENADAVQDLRITEDEAGNRTYEFTLYKDLQYSDGTPITAWDYAFSILLQGSAVIAEIGGTPANYAYLMGFPEYASGQTVNLKGLRVLSDTRLALQVKAGALSLYDELSGLTFCPYPIREIAPGCKVYDSGEGAWIGNADAAEELPLFTAELLMRTVLDPERGYLSHPMVTSGLYKLVRFDGEMAELIRNPRYIGNGEAELKIRSLTYASAGSEE